MLHVDKSGGAEISALPDIWTLLRGRIWFLWTFVISEISIWFRGVLLVSSNAISYFFLGDESRRVRCLVATRTPRLPFPLFSMRPRRFLGFVLCVHFCRSMSSLLSGQGNVDFFAKYYDAVLVNLVYPAGSNVR